MRCAVYTTLIGNYEHLNEQPVAGHSSLPFICLTDDPALRSESWEIRLVKPVFARDPIRSQRDLKLRPHLHLPEFDGSLYIDNSVLLKLPPERLFEEFAGAPDGLLMPPHSFRETVLDEFMAIADMSLDEDSLIFEQLNHYLLDYPEVLQEHPWWSAIMVRDHRNPRLRAALETWALHVMRYSRRDQLSVNVVLRACGIVPKPLAIDNEESAFHTWPHMPGRDRRRGERNRAVNLMPPVARLRFLEQQLDAAARQFDTVLNSTSWRATAPLRRLGRLFPAPLLSLVRRALNLRRGAPPGGQ